MSFSIEMRSIPSRTLQMVDIDESRVFVEAWGTVEADKQALRDIRNGLTEGTDVLVEATETGSKPETVCGVRRPSWLEMYGKGGSGGATLILYISLIPPASPTVASD